jgi:hypothetical protein
VNGEWRLAISDWWMIFLEGSAPALPKNPAHQEMRPPDFRRINSALKSSVINHWLKPVT